jgi:thioredoxin 1
MKRRWAITLLGVALLAGCNFEFEGADAAGGYGIDPLVATEANFDEVVLSSSKPVMVDVWAEWCGPCAMLKPTVHELAADYEGRVVVAQLDTDANMKLAERYRVEALPTLLFFKGGELVDRIIGAADKEEIATKLDALLTDSSVASSN